MVAHVIVKLVNEEFMGEFYFQKDPVSLGQRLRKEGQYRTAAEYFTPVEGEAAAEQAFDIANNPSKGDERIRIFQSQRSVSVGDVVEVDGVPFLCASMSWEQLA